MVLIDTSVWIKFFAGEPAFQRGVSDLLASDYVYGHELVYGELLIGDRGGRRKFLQGYELMHQANLVAHRELVAFVRNRNLHGRGVGWIDIHLLASVLADRLLLWTADPRLAAMAGEFGVAYKTSGLGGPTS